MIRDGIIFETQKEHLLWREKKEREDKIVDEAIMKFLSEAVTISPGTRNSSSSSSSSSISSSSYASISSSSSSSFSSISSSSLSSMTTSSS